MNNGIISILDDDELYARCFAAYLTSHGSSGYQATLFTDIDKLTEYSKKNHIDILLANEKYLNCFSVSPIQSSYTFILCESENCNTPSINKCDISFDNFIYKYQSAELLLHQILQVVSKDNSIIKHGESSYITGIYSPVKRSGRTSLAIAIAELYSLNSSTLFISFDEFADKYLILDDNSKNLSHLIFFFLENKSTFISKISSVATSRNLLDIVPPANFPRNIRELSSIELMNMLEHLRSSLYQNIVIDFSDTTSDILSVLTKCDIIYAPVLNDYISMSKYDSFMSNALIFDSEFYSTKIQKVHLPDFEVSSSTSNIFHNISLGPLGNFASELISQG